MCADCAPSAPPTEPPGEPSRTPRRFAALVDKGCRRYLFGAGLAMMADNIEHVITYWVLWQTFHSPFLVGFQVISHWVPFLLFSVHFGSLADRYDCRRVIQSAQALFMAVSAGWGVLFLTGTLHIWEACVLLVLHGCAGALWGPAEQLLLHDLVGTEQLPSAVRLNATFRSLGVLFGPVVGSVLLLSLGPTSGIFANIAFYLPVTVFCFRTRFTGHTRHRDAPRERTRSDASSRPLRALWSDPVVVAMTVLAGLGSFFVGASVQSLMPSFAHDLTGGSAGAYTALLTANGAGGVLGGILLEFASRFRPDVRAAVLATLLYGGSTLAFAVTDSYVVALVMLVVGGIAALASMSITQTVVQLRAPVQDRGRVLGLYGVASGGLRAGSGVTVGFLGAALGLHGALALSASALCVGTLAAGWYAAGGSPRRRRGDQHPGREKEGSAHGLPSHR
ncbi:MFS transporter [Streptomyces sp. MBT62]|uniref:MFS transporter n=1 Tax=Streptomyces sp. MBT62 TaxID=2800410 RepID=UPI00190BC153|nr:MFS transporter [Streptomyces sp. MBT62]MBK3565211.1 MFS transporter [Streptomyces sp. MBT62]